MSFSPRELEAMQQHPISDDARQYAKKLQRLMNDDKPWYEAAEKFLMRGFVENPASNVVLTRRRDCDADQELASAPQPAPQSLGDAKKRRSGSSDTTKTEDDKDPISLSISNANAPYSSRTLTAVLTQPTGKPISTVDMDTEMLYALKYATMGHRSRFEAGILHRHVSVNKINKIIMTDPTEENGQFKGMLIGLDMAEYVTATTAISKRRTGTLEFMAYDVLMDKPHTYLHDFESCLYVLMSLCGRLPSAAVVTRKRDVFTAWREGTMTGIANQKRALVKDIEKFDNFINRAFSNDGKATDRAHMKRLCREIRYVLGSARSNSNPADIYSRIDEAYDFAIVNILKEEKEEKEEKKKPQQ